MKKSRLLGAVSACVFTISMPSYAVLVDNGDFTTDLVSGLDWLDLTFTDNMSYNDAGTSYPTWRYATNAEVVGLFETSFDGFYSTSGSAGASDSRNGSYADQGVDVANWQALMGLTEDSDEINGRTLRSYGMYEDEDFILRLIGAADVGGNLQYEPFTLVFGTEASNNLESNRTVGGYAYGVLMVRTSEVPIPASLWLFGSGLLGLIGMARRKAVTTA